MEHGDFVSHRYEYNDTKMKKYIIYCLKNCNATNESGLCFNRILGGLIQIYRPNVIGDYNDNMGGADIADTRIIYCNSQIMVLHRWGLKLFLFIYLTL